jgi:hypothetical protein
MIFTGYIKAGIADGVELLSDFPIRYNRTVGKSDLYIYHNLYIDLKVRESLIDLQKAKSWQAKVQLGGKILSNILNFDLPSVSEYTTGIFEEFSFSQFKIIYFPRFQVKLWARVATWAQVAAAFAVSRSYGHK